MCRRVIVVLIADSKAYNLSFCCSNSPYSLTAINLAVHLLDFGTYDEYCTRAESGILPPMRGICSQAAIYGLPRYPPIDVQRSSYLLCS